MMSKQTIPIFRIFDLSKAKEFYVEWLGFTVDWEHQFEENTPIYMQVSRDNLILHLSEHHGDCCPGAKIIVNTDSVEELHREISAKNYKYNRVSPSSIHSATGSLSARTSNNYATHL